MDANIPEEIKEKLKIIEKETDFSQKMMPPIKIKGLLFGGFCCLILAIVIFIDNKNIYELALFFLVGLINIAAYFEYKKLYHIHSNARDIINYYRNRAVNT